MLYTVTLLFLTLLFWTVREPVEVDSNSQDHRNNNAQRKTLGQEGLSSNSDTIGNGSALSRFPTTHQAASLSQPANSIGSSCRCRCHDRLMEGCCVGYYLASKQPLWEHSLLLPIWMKEYFTWHQQKRKFLQQYPEQWQSIRYYLVECTERYPNCGGTADRLGLLPYHVQYAAAAQRLLLFHWSIPAPLESFLLPPQYGIDWTVPSWLQQQFDETMPTFPIVRNHHQHRQRRKRKRNHNKVTVALDTQDLMDTLQFSQLVLVRAKIQLHDHGANSYNSMIFRQVVYHNHNNNDTTTGSTTKATPQNNNNTNHSSTSSTVAVEPTFEQVFHDLWRIFFTPVPSIAAKIHQQVIITTLDLSPPGSYIAMHLRLLYGETTLTDAQIQRWTRNMIHCTIQYLVPTFLQNSSYYNISMMTMTTMTIPTLLFVSDSIKAIQEAVVYARMLQIPLVHRPMTTNQNPLHLEKNFPRHTKPTNHTNVDFGNADAFHDTFVDMYSLAMSQCVAYQAGGFGRWGRMMSYDSSCYYFLKPGQPEICPPPPSSRRFIRDNGNGSSIHHHNNNHNTRGDTRSIPVEPLFLPPMSSETNTKMSL
jgi:hypothetical protein